MALSRAAALELGPSGITINCVLPGFTRTNNNCHVPHTIDESFIPITPTGRVTVAQDIANACLFFAGEEAAQITAQCLPRRRRLQRHAGCAGSLERLHGAEMSRGRNLTV